MTQLDAEFAAASLEGYEGINYVCNRFTVNGVGSYQRGVACGLLMGFVTNLARATSRECAHEALRHAMADFGGAAAPVPEPKPRVALRSHWPWLIMLWANGFVFGLLAMRF